MKEVINGLEMSYKYSNVDENNTLVPQWIVLHALALLKAQEPRVMTLEELQQSLRGGDTVFLLEVKGSPLVWTLYMGYSIKEYGMTWRC